MTAYSNVTNNLLMSCENSLGVYTSLEGKTLEFLPIEDFCVQYKKIVSTDGDARGTHLSCGEYLTSLCYLDSLCNYHRVSVLDFSKHKHLDTLANLLIPFTKKIDINKSSIETIDSIILYLALLEKQAMSVINSMAYRYLRLFISLAGKSDYAHSSIVANFILNQLFIDTGLDEAIKQKSKELKSAKKKVDKLITNNGEDPNVIDTIAAKVEGFIDFSKDKADEILNNDGQKEKKEVINLDEKKESEKDKRLRRLKEINNKKNAKEEKRKGDSNPNDLNKSKSFGGGK